jgi:hypothetical protein
VQEPNDSGEPGRSAAESDRPRSAGRPGWESVRSRLGEFGVLAPLGVILIGVGLDRAGFPAVGVTLTFLGGVGFVVMLYVLARWG